MAGELILDYCNQYYLWETAKERWHRTIDVEEPANYFEKLFGVQNNGYDMREKRSVLTELIERRKKRKSVCVRKEIRQMSRKEWKRFIFALQKAKEDTSITPSVWDFFGSIHTSPEVKGAHYGPAFLPWHRIFLTCLETALQKYHPKVCLPYWDTRIDYFVDDITNSVVFSKYFLGKQRNDPNYPYGNVGEPFNNWNLTRNLKGRAQRDMLVSPPEVEWLLRHSNMSRFTAGIGELKDTCEFYHNKIHVWLGGDVSGLETAAYDPIFWLLHCFIDYLFQCMRDNQIRDKLDCESYPKGNYGPLQNPDKELKVFGKIAKIIGFENSSSEYLMNKDGYSKIWDDQYFRYLPAPSCKNKCKRKAWMKCYEDTCVSKSLNGKKRWFNPLVKTEKRKKRSAGYDTYSHGKEHTYFTDQEMPIQNTYFMDGRKDSGSWVYMGVGITFYRPEGIHYASYPVKDGKIQYDYDIYDIHGDANHTDDLHLGHPAALNYCGSSGTGSSKVFVQAIGVNYYGPSRDYGIVDERYPVSNTKAYIAVRRPRNNNPTEVIFSAYDECGRLCKPLCLVEGSSPPAYIKCTGVMKIDTRKPLVYSETLVDAMMGKWSQSRKGEKFYPNSKNSANCIHFLCDSADEYPWD